LVFRICAQRRNRMVLETKGRPLTANALPVRFLSTYYPSLAAFVHAKCRSHKLWVATTSLLPAFLLGWQPCSQRSSDRSHSYSLNVCKAPRFCLRCFPVSNESGLTRPISPSSLAQQFRVSRGRRGASPLQIAYGCAFERHRHWLGSLLRGLVQRNLRSPRSMVRMRREKTPPADFAISGVSCR
jgi:hypothetical protein